MEGPGPALYSVGRHPLIAPRLVAHPGGGPGIPTFITKKKARVPKMVNCGWYHSNHRFWGSSSLGQGGDEFRVISAHELLSNSESRCCFMDSWSRVGGNSMRGQGSSPCHPLTPSSATSQQGRGDLGMALNLPD